MTRINVSHTVGKKVGLMVQALDRQAADVRSKTDRVILQRAFGTWIASERSNLLASVHDTRLTRDCIHRWRNKRNAIVELEGKSLRMNVCLKANSKWWSQVITSRLY